MDQQHGHSADVSHCTLQTEATLLELVPAHLADSCRGLQGIHIHPRTSYLHEVVVCRRRRSAGPGQAAGGCATFLRGTSPPLWLPQAAGCAPGAAAVAAGAARLAWRGHPPAWRHLVHPRAGLLHRPPLLAVEIGMNRTCKSEFPRMTALLKNTSRPVGCCSYRLLCRTVCR
jgi:hypothetical protein